MEALSLTVVGSIRREDFAREGWGPNPGFSETSRFPLRCGELVGGCLKQSCGCGGGARRHPHCRLSRRKHDDDRRFPCPVEGCGKSFTRAEHLKGHSVTHLGTKPFACPVEGGCEQPHGCLALWVEVSEVPRGPGRGVARLVLAGGEHSGSRVLASRCRVRPLEPGPGAVALPSPRWPDAVRIWRHTVGKVPFRETLQTHLKLSVPWSMAKAPWWSNQTQTGVSAGLQLGAGRRRTANEWGAGDVAAATQTVLGRGGEGLETEAPGGGLKTAWPGGASPGKCERPREGGQELGSAGTFVARGWLPPSLGRGSLAEA